MRSGLEPNPTYCNSPLLHFMHSGGDRAMPENILVVDDEREIADLVELYLQNENYEYQAPPRSLLR